MKKVQLYIVVLLLFAVSGLSSCRSTCDCPAYSYQPKTNVSGKRILQNESDSAKSSSKVKLSEESTLNEV